MGANDPFFGGLSGGSDPQTGGIANSKFENSWARMWGKWAPTDPKLPVGAEWMAPAMQHLTSQGMGSLRTGDNTSAGKSEMAGRGGAMAGGAAASAIDPAILQAAFAGGGAGLGQALSTGFAPSMDHIVGGMMPSRNRLFESGAAGIREQANLLGNLGSTGTAREIGNYGEGLDANVLGNASNAYTQSLLGGMQNRMRATELGLNLPGMVTGGVANPLMQSGLAGQRFPLEMIMAAMQGMGGAPYYAQQGSSGSGSGGGIMGSMMGK